MAVEQWTLQSFLSNLRHLRASQKHWLIAFVLPFRNYQLTQQRIIATKFQYKVTIPTANTHTHTLCNAPYAILIKRHLFFTTSNGAELSMRLNWIAIAATHFILIRVLQCNNIFYRFLHLFSVKLLWKQSNGFHLFCFAIYANGEQTNLDLLNLQSHSRITQLNLELSFIPSWISVFYW